MLKIRSTAFVATFADLRELAVVGARLRAIACRFGSATGTIDGPESIRLFLQASLELFQRVRRLLRVEQHLAQKLVRRRDRTGRDGRLLGRVFERRRRRQGAQRLVFLSLRPEQPPGRSLTLDVELR